MIPDLKAAVRQAEREIIRQQRDEITEAFLEETAGARPAPDQPGTLGEMLHAANLYLTLPPQTRRFRRAAWRACWAHVIPHARPIDQQAREWWRGKPKPAAQPKAKVRIRRDD